MKTKSKPKPRKPLANLKCFFCENKKVPNYLEVDELQRFITERGKILNRNFSGVCNKHQKKLSEAIKRSRHLALISFK